MVEKNQIPVVDEHNPFYRPSVSPNSYLATLHKSLSKSNVSEDNVSLYSFARILDQKFFNVDKREEFQNYDQDHLFAVARSRKSVSLLPLYSPPSWETRPPPAYPPGLIPSKQNQYTVALGVAPLHALKRKRSTSPNTFSDFEGPTKRGKSPESIHESSFDVSGKAERIFGSHFFDGSPVLGSTCAPILLPTKTDTQQGGNENPFLARIRALEGVYFGSSVS